MWSAACELRARTLANCGLNPVHSISHVCGGGKPDQVFKRCGRLGGQNATQLLWVLWRAGPCPAQSPPVLPCYSWSWVFFFQSKPGNARGQWSGNTRKLESMMDSPASFWPPPNPELGSLVGVSGMVWAAVVST